MDFFSYVNNGYSGEDLHIVRNDQYFDLHRFFDFQGQPGAAVYAFSLPLKNTSNSTTLTPYYSLNTSLHNIDLKYENITIRIAGNQARIKADTYSSTDVKVNNFYLKIYVTLGGITYKKRILIHIHNGLDTVYLTPNKLTVRKWIDGVRFGVLAKFTDGIIADISYYYDLTWSVNAVMDTTNQTSSTTYLSIQPQTDRILLSSTLPTSEKTYLNCIQLTLPSYLPSISDIKGSVILIPNTNTTPKLVQGDASNIAGRSNLLFIADGFNGLSDNATKFEEIVKRIIKSKKETINSPYDALAEDINYWYYYENSKESGGTLKGDFILLQSLTNQTQVSTISIKRYIEVCDDVIKSIQNTAWPPYKINNTTATVDRPYFVNNYMPKNYPQVLVDFLPWSFFTTYRSGNNTFPLLHDAATNTHDAIKVTLSELVDAVGMPGPTDGNIPMTTYNNVNVIDVAALDAELQSTYTKWATLGINKWYDSIIDTQTSDAIRSVSSPTTANTEYYLYTFVFLLWKMMANRMALHHVDTTFGIIRTNALDDGIEYKMDTSKFQNKIVFNKFISGLSDIGTAFFNSADGLPVFTDDEYVIDGTTYKVVKNGNNVVFLSKIEAQKIQGINRGKDFNGLSNTKYTDHYSIISLVEMKKNITNCTVDLLTINGVANVPVVKPKSETLPAPKKISFYILNSVVHEFSHNYLLDEYSSSHTGIYPSGAEEDKLTDDTVRSNIHTRESLLDQSQLSVAKIRWGKWPRVKDIAVSNAALAQHTGGPNQYRFFIGNTTCDFNIGTYVLLRQRDLFNAEFIKCEVVDFYNNNLGVPIIKTSSGNALSNVASFAKCILLYPYWDMDPANPNAKYYTLIHPVVYSYMHNNGNGIPLVAADNTTGDSSKRTGHQIQTPTHNFSEFRKKENIIGLYGGGLAKYTHNIYHPAGFCLMRSADTVEKEKRNRLCHVCKYIIVDALNPLKHVVIDFDYDEDYPI